MPKLRRNSFRPALRDIRQRASRVMARVFSLSFAICCAAPVVQAQPGPWTTAATGPAAHFRAGAASSNDHVYVFGGFSAFGVYLNDLWRWDPATEGWLQLANMPSAKSNIQGAYWNGKIYVPGGYNNSAFQTENTIYDVATDTWSTGAAQPVARSGATVAYNGMIFVFGGNPGPSNETLVYDIAGNSWSTGANMPAGITYGRAIVAGAYAYYVGGIAGSTTNTTYRYDFAANTWTTLAPLNTARTSTELMTDGARVYAVNGGDASFWTGVPLAQSVEIYDIVANTWTYGNPVITQAAASAGGLAGGKFMIMGGVDGATYLNTVQVAISDLIFEDGFN